MMSVYYIIYNCLCDRQSFIIRVSFMMHFNLNICCRGDKIILTFYSTVYIRDGSANETESGFDSDITEFTY